ncbi:CaiB/BaiF CoA-transferase family protein [Sphingomonas jatrophae]|uniref:Crotonobetainyl-CoA:carnitine CoA-transferase CaiB n=1 Tax=Sphingomonas jatrophae TaxID=1166337 RepID=A0A1I6KF35_9SPHN|nr:CoA transferase [Sphingomonas jatrophae]SFR89849.1 Crotonobetainyl-CoA:carnitine CoA-transferase CaiB [Sphingomonas jatrophae]
MDQGSPLARLRVVEVGHGIAAAYAGKMLADAGAAVTLVEPKGGSPLRRRKAAAAMGRADPLGPGETGALFTHLNRAKRIAAHADLAALLPAADLLIDDGGLAALGLDPGRLRADHPALSIVAISPWGADGPAAATPATEFTLQAETGSLHSRGYADRPPLATGGELGDYIAGSFAAVAALAAWRLARSDGRGHHIDLSEFEAMTLCLQAYQSIHGELEPGKLAATTLDVPSIERASDGWVGYATITDQQWRNFARMIGHAELGEDDDIRFGNQRFAALDRIQPLISAYTQTRTVEQLVAEALALRIPVTPLGDATTVRDMDHFRARGVFAPVPEGHEEPRPPYQITTPADATPPPPALPAQAGAALAGLRVLDLSAFWAGPMAGFVLAALGADVLKVESVQRPDGMRYAGGFAPRDRPMWECSPVFLGANAGKQGITLDLTRADGVALLKRLIADSDVLIENFSPRVMEGFGLSWDVVHALNPRLVMLRMPAFGLDGPWRDRTGFAMTMEQVSGMAALTGYPDRPPVPPRGCVDPLGGVNGAFATICALELRAQDGRGRLVEASLAEAGIAVSAEAVIDRQVYGSHLERSGNSGPGAVPQGVLPTRDGAGIALSIVDDAAWAALLALADDPELRRAAWQAAPGRRADEAEILDRLASWTAERDAASLVEALLAAGIAAAPLRNVRLLAGHPQLVARGFFNRMDHAVVGPIGFPNLPFRIDGAYPPLTRPAPLLGEHNEAVLRARSGLDDAALAALAKDRIIGTRPVQA